MKEKYDVPIAPESEFVSYMMEQMIKFGLPCTEEQAKDFYALTQISLNLACLLSM